MLIKEPQVLKWIKSIFQVQSDKQYRNKKSNKEWKVWNSYEIWQYLPRCSQTSDQGSQSSIRCLYNLDAACVMDAQNVPNKNCLGCLRWDILVWMCLSVLFSAGGKWVVWHSVKTKQKMQKRWNLVHICTCREGFGGAPALAFLTCHFQSAFSSEPNWILVKLCNLTSFCLSNSHSSGAIWTARSTSTFRLSCLFAQAHLLWELL